MINEAVRNLKNEARKNIKIQMVLEKINAKMPYILEFPDAASIEEICEYNRIIYQELDDEKLRNKIMA